MYMKELRKTKQVKNSVRRVSRKSGLLFKGLCSFGLHGTWGKDASKAHWSSGVTGNISDYFF